jgi:hypothetical protein
LVIPKQIMHVDTSGGLTTEEQMAAVAVASLSHTGGGDNKRQREQQEKARESVATMEPPTKLQKKDSNTDNNNKSIDTSTSKPGYPFFDYVDHSQEPDPDPLVPLTAPGRVPNFPAKMHAILSRPELADIVAWLPHGRSWRVLKPREFEVKVLPTYFEHSKFSSFIRQSNGWGFRRITQVSRQQLKEQKKGNRNELRLTRLSSLFV